MSAKEMQFEIISFGEDIGDVTKTEIVKRLRRRSLRVDVEFSDPPVFLGLGGSGELVRVKTIGPHGAAYLKNNPQPKARFGEISQSFLTVGEVRIPVVTKPLYSTPQWTGLEFVDPAPQTVTSIQTHFFIEYLAAALEPSLRFAPVSPGSPLRKVAYKSTEGHSVEIVLDGEEIHSFTVDFGNLWAIVKWEKGRTLNVSFCSSQEISDSQVRNQLISLTRNLRGMNNRILQILEKIARSNELRVEFS